jgi:hypothetical protein
LGDFVIRYADRRPAAASANCSSACFSQKPYICSRECHPRDHQSHDHFHIAKNSLPPQHVAVSSPDSSAQDSPTILHILDVENKVLGREQSLAVEVQHVRFSVVASVPEVHPRRSRAPAVEGFYSQQVYVRKSDSVHVVPLELARARGNAAIPRCKQSRNAWRTVARKGRKISPTRHNLRDPRSRDPSRKVISCVDDGHQACRPHRDATPTLDL